MHGHMDSILQFHQHNVPGTKLDQVRTCSETLWKQNTNAEEASLNPERAVNWG